MKLINDLLERYAHLKPPNDTVRKQLVTFIHEECGVEVPYENIRVASGVVYVDAHPSIKNTLFIKKHSILKRLNRTDIGDIR